MESINGLLSPLNSVTRKKPLCPSCLPKRLSSHLACSFCLYAHSMECFRRKTQGRADRISYRSMPSRPRQAKGWAVILLFVLSCLIPIKLFLLFWMIKSSVCVYVCIRKKHYNLFSADDLGTLWPEGSLTISPLFLLPNSRSVGQRFSTLAAVKSSGVLYKVQVPGPHPTSKFQIQVIQSFQNVARQG